MIGALSGAAGVSALLSIRAALREDRSFYALKPLTTVLIIAVAASATPAVPGYQRWVVIALLLCLAGDVALMFEGDRWFLAGMVGFLLAHLAFVSAFLTGLDRISPPTWSYGALGWGAALLAVLWRHLGRMRVPVLIYGAVLASMVIAAAARFAARPSDAAVYAMIGAMCFLVSDSLLSIQQFARHYAGAPALILCTYWVGIWLIARSV